MAYWAEVSTGLSWGHKPPCFPEQGLRYWQFHQWHKFFHQEPQRCGEKEKIQVVTSILLISSYNMHESSLIFWKKTWNICSSLSTKKVTILICTVKPYVPSLIYRILIPSNLARLMLDSPKTWVEFGNEHIESCWAGNSFLFKVTAKFCLVWSRIQDSSRCSFFLKWE